MARTTTGKLYTSGKKGYYYLRFTANGRDCRMRLLGLDGKPITRRTEAEKAAARLLKPLTESNKAEQLRLLKNNLKDAEDKAAEAAAELINSRATLAKGWMLFMSCQSRPKSCKRLPAGSTSTKSTVEAYHAYYRRFVEWMKNNHRDILLLSDVTSEHATAFAAALQAKTAAGTFNKYRFFLIAFFDALINDGKITLVRNPFSAVERMEGEPNSRRELSLAELQRIVEKAAGDLKLLLLVGACTGLRLGDCCTLQWGEIDMIRQIIRRKPRKTASRTQKVVTIGIPRALQAALDVIPQDNRTGYLLPQFAEMYLAPNGTTEVTKIIQEHFKSCGIETLAPGTGAKYHYEGKKKVYDTSRRAVVQVGFHSLRHTWVSLHAMHGTPQAIIQDAAGHANPSMTEHYVHVSPEAARKAAAALDLPQLTGEISDAYPTNNEPERTELHRLADTLPIEEIRAFLRQLANTTVCE